MWIDAHGSSGAVARVQWRGQVVQCCGQVVATVWADGYGSVVLVALARSFLFFIYLFIYFLYFPLNQAFVGLIV